MPLEFYSPASEIEMLKCSWKISALSKIRASKFCSCNITQREDAHFKIYTRPQKLLLLQHKD